jgi:hypothetical protein
MFERNCEDGALGVNIDRRVFVEVSRLDDLAIPELDVERGRMGGR